MKNTMTKAQMAEMLEAMATELAALKAEKAATTPVVKAVPEKKVASRTSAKASKSSEPVKVVLPVRKGKTVSFDSWLNSKVYTFNKPLMERVGGVYNRSTKSIDFPSAKAAKEYCDGFVARLTDEQYENSRKAIDESFKARAAARAEKKAASTAPVAKTGSLIAGSVKAGKKGSATATTSTPVKKPEWRERAGKGEKPFANYSTYKEYWHACIGK